MAITIITGQFALRDPELQWEQLGPGLYPGERAIQLTSGDKAAISVDVRWLPNGAGVWLHGNARWIDDTGQSNVDPEGEHVETNIAVTVPIADVRQYKLRPLGKDVAIMLAGEGNRLMRPAVPETETPAMPVIMVPQDQLDAVSIQNAADAVRAVGGFSLVLS